MKWFSEQLLNSTHWVYIRLLEDAPRDRIHQHLIHIFDIGVMDTVNQYLQTVHKTRWRLDNQ